VKCKKLLFAAIIAKIKMARYPLDQMESVMTNVTTPVEGVVSMDLACIANAIHVKQPEEDLLAGYIGDPDKNVKIPPRLYAPGEIISMRFDGVPRGLRRSVNIKPFPHSIVTDICTRGPSSRHISVKLSKTIVATGGRSFSEAIDVSTVAIELMIEAQENLDKLYNLNPESDEFELQLVKIAKRSLPELKLDESTEVVMDYYEHKRRLYVLAQGYDRPKMGVSRTELVNFNFRLDGPVNLRKLDTVMNASGIFSCDYSTMTGSVLPVVHTFMKMMRTGKMKDATVGFRVNSNGTVQLSGWNVDFMIPLYNSFIKIYIENKEMVSTKMKLKISIKMETKGTYSDYLRRKEVSRKYMSDLMAGNLSLAQPKVDELDTPEPDPMTKQAMLVQVIIPRTVLPVMDLGFSNAFL
jgi:hypothetical protein